MERYEWDHVNLNAMDPRALSVVRAWFSSVDVDGNGSIDEEELAKMRLPGIADAADCPIGLDGARKFIKLFDRTLSGTLGSLLIAAIGERIFG